jgi:F-type H+-transporting ATPase subunit delta
MLPRRIAGRYAEALFGLAQQENMTGAWEQDLAAMAQVIAASPELREILTHPEVPQAKKQAMVEHIFQGKLAKEVLAVMFMLIKRGHDPDIATLHEIFIERWNSARRIVPVSVASAVPLSTIQTGALTNALKKRTGASIELSQAVDPELIAGMVITIGDRVIDASARTSLEGLRASMTGG